MQKSVRGDGEIEIQLSRLPNPELDKYIVMLTNRRTMLIKFNAEISEIREIDKNTYAAIRERKKRARTNWRWSFSPEEKVKKVIEDFSWIANLPLGIDMDTLETHFILETLKYCDGNSR